MTNLLNERFEDIINMLLHCRIKVEDKDDPNILDILSDIRAMPGVATVKQTRPLSDKKTTSGKRIIEINVTYNPKYIDAKNQTTYLWCDPKLKIRWPIKKPILSKRDKKAKAI